jgi:hypothetical protein
LNLLRRFTASVIPAKAGIQDLMGIAYGDANSFDAARRAAAGYFLVATRK